MATYLYRCPSCGYEREHKQPIAAPVPETFPLEGKGWRWTGEHIVPDSGGFTICECPLRRVYEPTHMVLGPTLGKHLNVDGYIDRDKYYGRDFAKNVNAARMDTAARQR